MKSVRAGQVEQRPWLVPQLCRITGLSERQRNDIRQVFLSELIHLFD